MVETMFLPDWLEILIIFRFLCVPTISKPNCTNLLRFRLHIMVDGIEPIKVDQDVLLHYHPSDGNILIFVYCAFEFGQFSVLIDLEFGWFHLYKNNLH